MLLRPLARRTFSKAATTEKLAHVVGATTPPLLSETVGGHFAEQARIHADRPALVVDDQQVRWSYDELHSKALTAAAGLLDIGLRRGDRLGVWMPNCSEWVVMQVATSLVGVVLVSINPAYRAGELRHALNLSGCRGLVMAPRFADSDYVRMLREIAPEIEATPTGGELSAEALPHLRSVVLATGCGREEPLRESAAGFLAYEELVADRRADSGLRSRIEALTAELDAHDPINIQFTSGTTGLPKGASLTHYNILNNGRFIGHGLALTPDDRVCIPVPLYHCFGIVLGNLACMTHGAAMIYPKAGFDPEATLRVTSAERCTALYGVPTMFIAELGLSAGPFFLTVRRVPRANADG